MLKVIVKPAPQAIKYFSTSSAFFAPNDERGATDFRRFSLDKFVSDDKSIQNDENRPLSRDRVNDEFCFDKNFRFLKTRVPYKSHAEALQLVYLPLISYRAFRERVFVEQLCHLWWSAFEPHLTTKTLRPSDIVKGTMFGLRKLDESTDGGLSKVFGWNSVITLTDYVLKSLVKISPNNFDMFLYSLCSFQQYRRVSTEEKNRLKEKLNASFPLYLNAALNGQLFAGQYITNTITKTAFRLQTIGIDRPSEDCLHNLVLIFVRVVNEMEHSSSLVYLRDLHFIALVLVRWNCDAKKYDGLFWTTWYEKMARHYQRINQKSGFYNAMIVTDWLLVALKFDQEKEFVKILPMWLSAFSLNRHWLYRENLEFLIEQTKKKYTNDPLGRLDPRSLTSILNVLRGNY